MLITSKAPNAAKQPLSCEPPSGAEATPITLSRPTELSLEPCDIFRDEGDCTNGGGVACYNGEQYACVCDDLLECPGLVEIITDHEQAHVDNGHWDCPPVSGVVTPQVAEGSLEKAREECALREVDVELLNDYRNEGSDNEVCDDLAFDMMNRDLDYLIHDCDEAFDEF